MEEMNTRVGVNEYLQDKVDRLCNDVETLKDTINDIQMRLAFENRIRIP